MGWAFKLIHLQFLDSPDPQILCFHTIFKWFLWGRFHGVFWGDYPRFQDPENQRQLDLPAKLAALILILQDATWQKCTSINWTKVAQFDSVRGWKDGWLSSRVHLLKLGMFRCLSRWVLFQFFVEVKVSRSCSLRSDLVLFLGKGAPSTFWYLGR